MEKVKSEVWFDDGDEDEDSYDAIVVGSGYGGSVAACRMSVAGIKVCLVEKGRRWESKDFPTDSLKIMSAVRIENRNLGISFGPKDALFQVYEQDDSLAAVACGLGGGSLVNAGVMLPTPIRARRNPKWPKEWERDWEICEASASATLRIQSVPTKFPNAKVMEEMVGEDFEESCPGPVNLSVNFDIEEQPSSSVKSQGMGNCLGCGNCLTGCPYDAKNSTDKTYLVSAIQAGCTVKTECQVQYVIENPDYTCQKKKEVEEKRRRWLVYFNEIDYVTADFVILSAGVFGTAGILFQSQLRGLKLSERLGSGFSCNGNTVAYLAGSPAPLNAYGLGNNTFSKIPFEERPGPSISSSYTSSLGFTIQVEFYIRVTINFCFYSSPTFSAVLPVAYPYLLFKGITTYGWPTGFWFLHGVIDKLKHMLGPRASNAMILNAMGFDESDGKITFEKDTNTICFRPPHDRLLPRKLEAFQKLTKKLGGILFMSRYRSTSVHLLGGCNASPDPSCGVCNPKGQVFDGKSQSSVYQGLYVCDASLIPCCIGINPCLTITTLAEHVSRHLVKDILMHKAKEGTISMNKFVDQRPGSITSMKLDSSLKSMVVFKETMRGYVGGMPCRAYLKLQMNSKTSKKFRWKELTFGGLTSSIKGYVLEGKKVMNPYLFALYAWRETTTMHVTFKKVVMDSSKEEVVSLKGKLSISLVELLKCLISLEGDLRGRFYMSSVKKFSMYFCFSADDGFIIRCRQWKSNEKLCRVGVEKKLNPVLLINGARNLATATKITPVANSSNIFTIEDIGRFDIPAVVNGYTRKEQDPSSAQTLKHQFTTPAPEMHCPFGATLREMHLKICNAGFIVNPNGENSYLIHPERMALPTLYISGGKTLLVTPQTSFLANNYMKLHQPVFRHERVVVEGFGHSDLLIGEESYIRVFPHILSHIRLAEEGKKCVMGSERSKNNKEALAWGDDPFVEANGGFWSWISPLVTMWLLSLFLVMMVYFLL
ncbi:hypothetical protein Acr_12g0004470 [Actinidia rufa]|uniref:Cholesterol oxidase n=1 Tax=Actinidia rufa TaxID=165716 RepID=A0A7J0FHI7_9ERIC|nr:hypothetical protein Acr_12g0004470 [Actinidia rufa]